MGVSSRFLFFGCIGDYLCLFYEKAQVGGRYYIQVGSEKRVCVSALKCAAATAEILSVRGNGKLASSFLGFWVSIPCM